jgi:hypothetical protein
MLAHVVAGREPRDIALRFPYILGGFGFLTRI